jgi:hypothetical protein
VTYSPIQSFDYAKCLTETSCQKIMTYLLPACFSIVQHSLDGFPAILIAGSKSPASFPARLLSHFTKRWSSENQSRFVTIRKTRSRGQSSTEHKLSV